MGLDSHFDEALAHHLRSIGTSSAPPTPKHHIDRRTFFADVKALGLTNIQLLDMDIMDFSEAHGQFDYVIAHGVYSWVPNAVQERLLAICAHQLRPAGIAYVSYNTLPGWRMRSVVRDAMTYHTRGIAEPAKRVAQARITTAEALVQADHAIAGHHAEARLPVGHVARKLHSRLHIGLDSPRHVSSYVIPGPERKHIVRNSEACCAMRSRGIGDHFDEWWITLRSSALR